MFDTLKVFLKEFFEKVDFEKKSADNIKNMQHFSGGRVKEDYLYQGYHRCLCDVTFTRKRVINHKAILYGYFMPVCSIVKTITPRCRGRPDPLLHKT